MHAPATPRLFVHTLAGVALGLVLGCSDGTREDDHGSRCDLDADCVTERCYVGPSLGYCTSPCSQEGATDGCRSDTVCASTRGGDLLCLLTCTSVTTCVGAECESGSCPAGFSCVDVANAPGGACVAAP